MLRSVIFEVTGDQQLHCEGCEQRIERVLKAVQGIRQVRAEASSQRIQVLFETAEIEESAIRNHLRSLGYTTEAAIRPAPQSGRDEPHPE